MWRSVNRPGARVCFIPPDAKAVSVWSRTPMTKWGLHHLSAGSKICLFCPPKRIPKYEYGYFCPFPHRMLSFLEAACGGKLVNYQVVGTKTAEIAKNPCFCLHPPSLFPSSLYFLSKRLLSPTRRVYETAESSTVVTSQHRDSRSASRIEKQLSLQTHLVRAWRSVIVQGLCCVAFRPMRGRF